MPSFNEATGNCFFKERKGILKVNLLKIVVKQGNCFFFQGLQNKNKLYI
jgi:hypothetical protein